jgi:F420-non-reducing hydrogenase iron-sulfur subunit
MPETTSTIIAFVCNWCSYAGADQAGGLRLDYPVNIKLVRVMCSGRVDPQFVMDSFRKGADGVMILGCHPGDCHYRNGNIKAMKRSILLEQMLPTFGIDRKRFRLDWVAAGEAERFKEVVTKMSETIKNIGPLHLKGFVESEVA